MSRRIDLDHTIPYLSPEEGGPPGQTRIGNLGLHTRHHHRLKTHGGWQVRQPEPGTWLWRSPHHRIYLVNATGTHPLGETEYAHTIWHTARPATESGELTRLSSLDSLSFDIRSQSDSLITSLRPKTFTPDP